MLRDPIDRVLSHFYYWNLEDDDWESVGNIDTECDGKSDKIRPYNQLSNNMVRHLGMDFEDGIWCNHQNRSMACQYASVGPEHLARAMTVLKGMDLVCFVDDFEGCLRQLRQLLHLPHKNKISIPKSNRARVKQKSSAQNSAYDSAKDDVRRRGAVATFNAADISLYQYARKEFAHFDVEAQ
ncbi:MAG: hypothetical protein SGILL_002881 [Bacillariaceae sp.]